MSSISITPFTRQLRCSMPSGGNAGPSVWAEKKQHLPSEPAVLLGELTAAGNSHTITGRLKIRNYWKNISRRFSEGSSNCLTAPSARTASSAARGGWLWRRYAAKRVLMVTVQEHYDSHLGPIYSWTSRKFDEASSRSCQLFSTLNLRPAPTGVAIDLGCGHGLQDIPRTERGFYVCALDTCEPLLNELRGRTSACSLKQT